MVAMRPLLPPLVLAGIAALALACSGVTPDRPATPAPSPSPNSDRTLVQAVVVDVIDGVTIEAEVDGRTYRIRYLGVDLAAEFNANPGTIDLFREALEFNRFLVEARTVELERGEAETDFEGNLLRYVYVDGEMANLAILVNGYATVSETAGEFRYQAQFFSAQEGARTGLRGIWDTATEDGERTREPVPNPTATTPFTGGTLPLPPAGSGSRICDFSGTEERIIKGNIDIRTGGHVYHVPGGLFYTTTVVDEALGDRWLCTEDEAVEAGWKKSKR
jgi:micrococcal nuclease